MSGVISSRDPAVYAAIAEGLERANKLAGSNAQKVNIYRYQGVGRLRMLG